jgi:hypothetical protein
VNSLVILLDVGRVTLAVDDEGGKHHITFLLSAAALDEESAISDDTIEINLLAVPALRVVVVEGFLD